MLWSGSSPRTVVRDSMWGFLLFAGVAWLARDSTRSAMSGWLARTAPARAEIISASRK